MIFRILAVLTFLTTLSVLTTLSGGNIMANESDPHGQAPAVDTTVGADGVNPDPAFVDDHHRRTVLAAGCFWCLEAALEKTPGVTEAISGYAGGTAADPSYRQVGSGQTGHREAVLVVYDTRKIRFDELLTVFWHNVDPFDAGGQFVDRGTPYLSGIFYLNEEQKSSAEQSKDQVATQLGQEVITPILPIDVFYPAENYHQDYYRNSSLRYRLYTLGNGREQRLTKIWGKKRKSNTTE